MTLFLAHLAFLVTIAPLLFLVGRILPAMRPGKGLFLLLPLVAAGVLFFFMRPHEDILTGLDNMAYRKMAETFLEGRELVQKDTTARLPPKELATAFYYRPMSTLRPTRDVVYQIAPGDSTTCPFFEPFLPLAAAGSHTPGRFLSLLAALWFVALLAACYLKSSVRGLVIALAFFLATAWPCWHLRGYHAEGAAALLVAIVYLSAAARPFGHPLSFALGAFTLSLSIAIHPTAILIAVPVGLSLVPVAKEGRQRLSLLVGGAVGIVPLVLITRYICHPYGDWTRIRTIRLIARYAVEHNILILAAGALGICAIASLVVASFERGRLACAWLDRKLGPIGWTLLALLPLASILALSEVTSIPFPALVRKGARSCWSGIGPSCLLLWSVGFLSVVTAPGRTGEEARAPRPSGRLLLMLLCWTSLAFLLVKGLETHVGLWSQRRFLPTVLLLTTLFAVSLSDSRPVRRSPWARWPLYALFVGCALFHLLRDPVAYLMVNEEGTRAWRDSLGKALEGAGLTVFDYHPHSVPFAADPRRTVLGLGKHAHGQWPAVEEWLSSVSETGTVTIATSWAPTPILESHASLVPYRPDGLRTNLFRVEYPVLAAKGFFPVQRRSKTVSVSLFSLLPNERLPVLRQEKTLDGGPIGLRGPWGQTRDAATWTREGSAVIGPVASRGTIVVTLDALWPEHPSRPSQTMTLTPPWGEGGAVTFEVVTAKEGGAPAPIVLELPAPTNAPGRTGSYRFTSPTPYDPSADGLRGYDADLGVLLRRIRIEVRED